jgi:hypothetical protein
MDKTEAWDTQAYQGITEKQGQNEARDTQVYQGITEKQGQNRRTGYTSLPGYNREARTKQKHVIHKFTKILQSSTGKITHRKHTDKGIPMIADKSGQFSRHII